jgi:AcrR family transcriptional regulator
MYRYFPGGRDELLTEVVTWEYRRFFVRLYEAIKDAASLEEVMERGLMVAHRAIEDHEVLQMVLRTEPEALESTFMAEAAPTRTQVEQFLAPYLERHALVPGVERGEAASFLARMVLSYMGAAGQWDLGDPEEVARLVRAELLAGIAPGGALLL